MQITRVTIHDLRYPMRRRIANSRVWTHERTAAVVAVETDAGVTGWGEAAAPVPAPLVAQHVIGRDPFDVGAIAGEMLAAGCSPAAWSALDIALFDLMGQAVARPVHQLLGGAVREHVPCYASGLFLYDATDVTADLAEEAARYAEAGFAAMKMKVGFGPERDAVRVRAVRDVLGPGFVLAVDANCAYDTASALTSLRRIADQDVYWYEEPVPSLEVVAYEEIRQQAPMPLAGGESLQGVRAFRELVAKRALDIVQPDIAIAGGFSACRKVEALAEAHGLRVLPHMWGTAIRLAATLHWQAVIRDAPGHFPEPCLFEYDMTENALRTDLVTDPMTPRQGRLPVPDAPGLGIDIDRDVLDRHTARRQEVGA